MAKRDRIYINAMSFKRVYLDLLFYIKQSGSPVPSGNGRKLSIFANSYIKDLITGVFY